MKEKKFNSAAKTIRAIKKQKHADSAIKFIEDNTKDKKLISGLEKLDKALISKLHAHDFLKNGSLLEISDRYDIYKKFLSDGEIYLNQLDSCFADEIVADFIRSHTYRCDTPEKEEILFDFLNKIEFKISNENLDLLYESPVVLHYFLSNPNIPLNQKGKILASGSQIDNSRVAQNKDKVKNPTQKINMEKSLSFAPESASDELLNKIGEDMRSLHGSVLETGAVEYNSYIALHHNLYIALAGLKNGDLPIETFTKYCYTSMDIGDKNISMQNLYGALKMFTDNAKINVLPNDYVSQYILMDNGVKYKNKHELEALAKIIKEYNINPFLIDQTQIKRTSRFFRDEGIITQKEFLDIYSDIGGYDKLYEDCFTINESDSKYLQKLNYDPTPTSYKEAILAIKATNKKINELTLDEANIFLIFAKKILQENGVYYSKISFEYNGIKENYSGTTNKQNKTIGLTVNDKSIEDLMHTIFHETNHLIQHLHCKSMKMDSDLDLIEFAQDDLMRRVDDDYYDRNYLYISKEFDADFSAYLQTAEFFSKSLDDEFESSLNNYTQIRQYYKVSNRVTEQNEIINLSTLFAAKLKDLYDNNTIKYCFLVNEIKSNHPILEYEYNLDTGLPRTIEELVDMINDASKENSDDSTQKIKACKYVLNARCSPDKVGEELAEFNRQALKAKLSHSTPEKNMVAEIDGSKNKFEKYQNLFNELKENMNKKIATASR